MIWSEVIYSPSCVQEVLRFGSSNLLRIPWQCAFIARGCIDCFVERLVYFPLAFEPLIGTLFRNFSFAMTHGAVALAVVFADTQISTAMTIDGTLAHAFRAHHATNIKSVVVMIMIRIHNLAPLSR